MVGRHNLLIARLSPHVVTFGVCDDDDDDDWLPDRNNGPNPLD